MVPSPRMSWKEQADRLDKWVQTGGLRSSGALIALISAIAAFTLLLSLRTSWVLLAGPFAASIVAAGVLMLRRR